MMRRALVILALGVLARCVGGEGGAFVVSDLRNPDAEEAAFVRLLNEYRASRGLAPVTATPLLNQVAYDHSLAMGTQRFFSHNDPSGGTPFTRMAAAGYPSGVAENIAAGNAGAAATFQQWRNSPGHNTNMLSARARAIGIGRAYVANSQYRYYWTNVFGAVVDSSATPDAGTPPRDSGVVARDAGTPPRDSGVVLRDSGPPAQDGGPPAQDGGPPAQDGGASSPGGSLPFGAACTEAAQCVDGECVPVPGVGQVCTRRCDDDCACPSTHRCVSASADGALRVCYPGAGTCGADAGVPASEEGTGVIRGSCAAHPAGAHPGAAGLVFALLLCARRRRTRGDVCVTPGDAVARGGGSLQCSRACAPPSP